MGTLIERATPSNPEQPRRSLIRKLAGIYELEETVFLATVRETVMPKGNASQAQVAAFLLVADQFGLNPFTDEIHAFPQGGGIKAVVGIDGFIRIANSNPQYDGIEHVYSHDKEGKIRSVLCRVYRKDRTHATEAEEFLDECFRKTDPWIKTPRRMLRHKATIQAIRYAFGISGIYERDEVERIDDAPLRVVSSAGIQSRLDAANGLVTGPAQGNPGLLSSQPEPEEQEPPVEVPVEQVQELLVPEVKPSKQRKPKKESEEHDRLSKKAKALEEIEKFKSSAGLRRYVSARETLEWHTLFNEEQLAEVRRAADERVALLDSESAESVESAESPA